MRTARYRCLASFLALATGGLFVVAQQDRSGPKLDSKVITNSIGMQFSKS